MSNSNTPIKVWPIPSLLANGMKYPKSGAKQPKTRAEMTRRVLRKGSAAAAWERVKGIIWIMTVSSGDGPGWSVKMPVNARGAAESDDLSRGRWMAFLRAASRFELQVIHGNLNGDT